MMSTATLQTPGGLKPMCCTLSPDVHSRTSCLPTTAPTLGTGLQLDVSEDSDDGPSRAAPSSRGEVKNAGIRYITEALLQKLTKQEKLAFVRSLNLSLAKSSGKKFKFIENLDKCEQLQVLNLSHNLIEKIEKLEKLHKLRELHLSYNRIRKIEGLEHMGSLQLLNLANNNIEHVPLWLSRKLRSLQCLNLQHNNISSLHEIVKLKSLKNLTELLLAENPVSNLPHYRLFLVFHLRALETLDGLPVSQQEREMAHQRFHMEEVERLEQELEGQLAAVEKLNEEKAATVQELEKHEMLIKSLQLQSHEQQKCQTQLERKLETKNELHPLPAPVWNTIHQLKRKAMELTRACQKQYELEQELAFHKIDAKFEPLPYYPDQELEEERSLPGESPYIGKGRHRRNTVTARPLGSEGPHGASREDMSTDVPAVHAVDQLCSDRAQAQAEERLRQLHQEIESAEQQILRASAELHQLEETVSQKRISEAEKEQLRQQLRRKVQQLEQLRGEVQALEGQLEKQAAQMSQTQGEMERLQDLLGTLDPSHPQHVHVKAQVSRQSQLLDMLSKRHRELEARLDHMLSRIAKETEEIKDLEQQLTDGQIAANEALKRDLEGIIAGLQEYLEGVKGQARRAQAECRQLQKEKEALQRHLQDSEEQRGRLEMVRLDAEGAKEELAQLQRELHDLRVENAQLCRAQDQISTYETELEAQLQERNTEVGQLKEELGRLHRLSQIEQEALQAELEKERHARENALAQVQLAVEKNKPDRELQFLQEENGSLRRQIHTLQRQLKEARATLLCPQEVTQRLEELIRSIISGAGEIRPDREEDALGRNLGRLQTELSRMVSAAAADRQEAASLREQLQRAQEEQKAAETRGAEKHRSEMRRWKEEMREARKLQALAEQRLQAAEDERNRLFAELQDQDRQVKLEDSRARPQLQSLDEELRELKRSMAAADKMTGQQLNDAKDQLHSMQGTVRKINKERAEDVEELVETRRQAAAAAQALAGAEAEIQVLQGLLRDRELKAHQVDGSDQQHQELQRLYRALSRQQAQTKRLQEQLAVAREDKSGNLGELLEEIEVLKNSLAQHSSFVSSLEEPHGGRGCWHYVPTPPNPPSVGSQGTQDSGLGSQYPLSPSRRQHTKQRGRKARQQPAAPLPDGYWVCSPARHGRSGTPGRRGDQQGSEEESDRDSRISGHHFTPPQDSVIYTVLPNGTPLPPGTVVYAPSPAGLSVSPGTVICGPPPAGVPLVFGPPPPSVVAPLVHAGVLLCNMPVHQQMEKELCTLQKQVRELRQQCRSEQHAGAAVQRLQEQRMDLEQEVQEPHRAASRLRRRREALQGDLTSLVGELELEQSLQQHKEVLDEVQCVESTLLRRRAELREADRLLMEAESDLKDTRAKTRETLQRHSKAQKLLEDTERELEEMEGRAQDTASQLAEANLTLRAVQEELQVLQRCRAEQDQTLLDVQEVVSSRDTEFQNLCGHVDRATERLETLMSSIQEAQSREAVHLGTLQELEAMLGQRKSELDRLNAEACQLREDECLLQENVEQQRQRLAEVLRQGEEEAQDLQRCIKELRVSLEALTAQKGELASQLAERRACLSLLSEEAQHEEQTLQGTLAQIKQHTAELKHVQEMIRLEREELQGIRRQKGEHQDELGKSQESLLKVQEELQDLQQAMQKQEAQDKRQRQLLEQEHLRALKDKVQCLTEQTQALERDRRLLREQCRNLEARRGHAERCLAVAEEGARAAEVELERIKQEQRCCHSLRQEVNRDAAAAQQQLQEKTEELNRVKSQLDRASNELEVLHQDVNAATRRRKELLVEQQQQREELQAGAESLRENQHRADLLRQKLQELEDELLKRQASVVQEDQHLQELKQEVLEAEKMQQQKLLKLQAQVQALEGALAERREKLDRVTARVTELEEQSQSLQRHQERWTQPGNHLGQTAADPELTEQESRPVREPRPLKCELEKCRKELQRVQEDLRAERRRRDELRARNQMAEARAMEAEQEMLKLQGNLATVEQEQQQSHQHVKKLQKELSSVSQERQNLKDELRSQQACESCRREIKEAMRSLKAEVEAELNSGIRELETPPSDISDTESHKENCPLLSPLRRPTSSAKDEQWHGDVLREKLRQQEDRLKAQLRRTMWSQEEALSQHRQQTEGSLQGLRRHVDKLDKLLLGSSAEGVRANASEPPLKHSRGSAPQASESWKGPARADASLQENRPDRSW